MHIIKKLLLKLFFPEYLALENFIDNILNDVVLDHSKQIKILRHVIKSEVWDIIKEKYEVNKE